MIKMGFEIETEIEWSKLDEFFESAENARGIVKYEAPYALYVEMPTDYDSKKPPLEPILDWVLRNINTEDPKGVAFAIQNKVYEEGTEGVFFLTDAKNEVRGEVAKKLIETNTNDIENLPENAVQDILEEILTRSNENLEKAGKVDTRNLKNSGTVIMNVDPESSDVSFQSIR